MSIVVVPPLKAHLLSSTALTPTQHGGGGLGKVVGIVAAVAVPFAAPAVAASIGLSAAIGATAASAVVGGVMGAGIAAATGGNIALGAVGGALGGGIAGYNAPAAGLNGGSAAAAGGAPGQLAAPAALTPTPVTGVALPPVPGAAVAPGYNAGLQAGQSFVPGAAGSSFVPGVSAASNTVSSTSNLGGSTIGNVPSAPNPLPPGFTPGVTPGSTPPIAGNTLGPGGTSLGSATGTYAGPVGPQATPTLSERFSGFVKDLPDKIMSSEAAQQAAGKLITMGAGELFVGDEPDMSAEEKARMAQLEDARRMQRELLEKKEAVSDAYVQQAANINPYYYGQQALTEEQNRLLRAQQAGLRRIDPSSTGARTAQMRRNALDKSRLSGFDRGRQEAEAKRLQYMQAAQSTAPTGAGYASAIAGDLAAADKRYQRLGAAGQEVSDIFTPITDEIFGTVKKKKLEEETV